MNATVEAVSAHRKKMEEWRRRINRHPETAFNEVKTAAFVASLLESWGYEVATGIGKTGVVASLSSGGGKKAVGLRADMDALPLRGAEGAMHACGHDGHTAMLLGAGYHLSRTRDFNGTVRLIFQPAEETMGGARAMIADGLFERFPVDAVFGMHNMPGLTQGTFRFKAGPMMAAVDNWEVELTGKGSHGSMPEKSVDPVVAGASLVMALQTVVSRNLSPRDSAVVTVGAFLAGEAGNVIPETAVLRLSIRSLTPEARTLVLSRVRAIISAQAGSFGVGCSVKEGPPGAVLVNDEELTAFAAGVAGETAGAENVSIDGETYMGSEDFAFYLEHKPGTYCMIGNGDTAMVHNPAYSFDDRNLSAGAAYWVALTRAFLR